MHPFDHGLNDATAMDADAYHEPQVDNATGELEDRLGQCLPWHLVSPTDKRSLQHGNSRTVRSTSKLGTLL